MGLLAWFAFMRLHVKTKMEYKGDFLLGIIAQLVGIGANYLLLWFLIHRFTSMGGWSGAEITLLYSLSLLTYALGAAFTSSQMMNLENLMMLGSFDLVMVRPMHPFFYISSRYFNVNILTQIVVSFLVFVYSIQQLAIPWTVWKGIFLLAIIISGAMIHAAILILIGAFTFVAIRSNYLFILYHNMKDFISYPISVFDKGIQIALTVLIPMAFINYYPLSILLAKQNALFPNWIGWLAPLAGPLLLFIACQLWVVGLNKYQSAGG